MNKLILIAIIGYISNTQLLSQAAFPTWNANWCYSGYGDHGEPNGGLCISPIELVELNGYEYSRVNFKRHPDAELESLLYREENRKFYILPQDSFNEILVYDFGLSVGDTFSTSWGWALEDSITLTVKTIDTITTTDGVARKLMTLADDNAGLYGTWLEGIGNLEWVFVYPGYKNSVSGGFIFGCHAVDNLVLYPFNITSPPTPGCGIVSTNDEISTISGIKIAPNPIGEDLYVQLSDIDKIQIRTMAGVIIYEVICNKNQEQFSLPFNWQAGIYIIQGISNDGKTYVQKIVKH